VSRNVGFGVIEVMDHNFGMQDPTWRRHGRWDDCHQNPYAAELKIGEPVRVNYRDHRKSAAQPRGHIKSFHVEDGMVHAKVGWTDGRTTTVPRWALIKD
jgi:hypothetical protein